MYRLQTNLSKDECLRRLNEYLQKGILSNIVRTNIFQDEKMFLGKVNGDAFSVRPSQPFSLSYAVPFSRRASLSKTFEGKVVSDEQGAVIIGKNKLNSTSYLQIFLWIVVLFLGVYIALADHYFFALIIFGYLLFYGLSKFRPSQRISQGRPSEGNIFFLKEILQAEEA
jgi:hypothetical protein